MHLKPKIKVKIKRLVFHKGDPFFYIVWDYYVEGKKYFRGSNFPFSMS